MHSRWKSYLIALFLTYHIYCLYITVFSPMITVIIIQFHHFVFVILLKFCSLQGPKPVLSCVKLSTATKAARQIQLDGRIDGLSESLLLYNNLTSRCLGFTRLRVGVVAMHRHLQAISATMEFARSPQCWFPLGSPASSHSPFQRHAAQVHVMLYIGVIRCALLCRPCPAFTPSQLGLAAAEPKQDKRFG